jgi:molecular chaperone DnaK
MTNPSVFGIDLGTTYSCIAYIDQFNQAVVIRNSEGDATTPSVVFFENAENIVTGKTAKNNARIESERVVSYVKRSMGHADYSFEADGQIYNAQGISSFILRRLVADAEAELNQSVRDVVITCPAYFGTNEVAATMDAGKLAGLNVLGILREPVAAALNYGLTSGGEKETVLVYDLGGGTFDTTLITIDGNDIRVLRTGGDHQLGGKDWDDRIVEYLASQFEQAYPDAGNPLSDMNTAQELANIAEARKQELSTREKTRMLVLHNGQRHQVELTREQFEGLTSDLLERTVSLTQRLLDDALAAKEPAPTRLLLVGGSSKMPAVSRRLREALGLEPQLTDPDLAIAKGAAHYANRLGLANRVQEILEAQGAVGDSKAEEQAIAAVAQASGLSRDAIRDSLVRKIEMRSSKAFGVEVLARDKDGERSEVEHLVDANTALPYRKEATFYTIVDGQQLVEVIVYEQSGERASAILEHNTEIVRGTIHPLPPGLPARSPIQIIFQLSPEGLLNVYAREPQSGRDLSLEKKVSGVMSDDEIRSTASKYAGISVS